MGEHSTWVHASEGEAQVQVVSSYGLLLWRPATASSRGELLQTTTPRELKMTWTWAVSNPTMQGGGTQKGPYIDYYSWGAQKGPKSPPTLRILSFQNFLILIITFLGPKSPPPPA